MTDYLPEVFQQFEHRFPDVKEAFDSLGAAEHQAGPLSEKEPSVSPGLLGGAWSMPCKKLGSESFATSAARPCRHSPT